MNSKIKKRIARKVERQLHGSYPTEVMTIEDCYDWMWSYEDWSLD